MGTYISNDLIAGAAGTSNSSANTEDVFLEFTAPSGKEFYIRRIRVFYRGDTTAVGDYNVEARLVTVTTATTGTLSTATPTPISPTMPASMVTSYKLKYGTTACVLGTGTVLPLTNISFNERGFYEWIATDAGERYSSGVAGIVELAVKSSGVSRQYTTEIEYDE